MCLTRPIAVLTALAVLLPAVGAEAKTHRFARSQEVVVRFNLLKPGATGTLIRFVRNRLTLSRGRTGNLMLKRKGSPARRVRGSGHRSVSIRVALSVPNGKAKLAAGRRTAGLASRFVAEDAVLVRRGGTIRGLRIWTDRSGLVQGGDREEPSRGSPPSEPVRLFAPDSVWNAPLADSAALDPNSEVLVGTLRDTVTENLAAGWGPWIERSATTPLYVVGAGQPTVRVQLDPGSGKQGLQQTFEAVPIPPDAVPALGPDAHMTVWQPSSDRLWEFFRARELSDGWHANFGGAIASVSRFPGYYTRDAWPGLSESWWGATATSLPAVAGTITIDELRAGVIPHALALNIPWALPNVYSWPAQRTDGTSTDPDAIPEGARFRLDPDLDIDRLDLPPMARMMATAMQRYGMIVRDQTGHAVSFFAENSAQFGTDPYTGAGGFFGGLTPDRLTRALPWEHLQLVKMELHP